MGYLEDRAGLDGRRAVVVGGGGGLGRACAVDLAGAGVRLALCDRDEAALADTATVIREAGGQATTAVLDARDPAALARFFQESDDGFGGGLDILVNVVGGTFQQPFVDSGPKGWDALVRANFLWLLGSVQSAVPRMEAAGGGSIVNLTSIEAHRAAPGYAVYAAMKAAVTSLTRTLAVELAPAAIRVNTIAPDLVPTPGMGDVGAEVHGVEVQHRISIPMGRVGSYADVGGCVLFLASALSSFVTGTTLHPDGGALASSGWWNWPGRGFLNHPPPEAVGYLVEE